MPRARIPTSESKPRKPGSLLGTAEIAELAGVSKQRVTILAKRADFPQPEVELRMGKVWRAEPVKKWLQAWQAAAGGSGADSS